MKKLIILILVFISMKSIGQNIDTVYVRNLNLRAEEWYWLKSYWTPRDSLEKKAWKKIRTALVAANPSQNNTMVNIDSIPGRIALFFYNTFNFADKGQTLLMSNDNNSIATKIKAYTPIASFCTTIDNERLAAFQNNRQNGKDDFNN